MTWLYAVQLAVPLILIGWLLWAPHLHVHAQRQGKTEAPRTKPMGSAQ